MNTSERIRNIISAVKCNNSAFAKKIGVSNTTIDGYTRGRKSSNGEITVSQPNYDVIKKIVKEFNINAYYILGLSDEMFIDQEKSFKSSVDKKDLTEISLFINQNLESFKNIPIFRNLIDIEALKLVLKAKEGEDINVKKLYDLMSDK